MQQSQRRQSMLHSRCAFGLFAAFDQRVRHVLLCSRVCGIHPAQIYRGAGGLIHSGLRGVLNAAACAARSRLC
jgi:hypothetical protein